MNRKNIIIYILLISLLLSGCKKNEMDSFKDVEDIVEDHQINIHFAWKNEELQNDTTYSFAIYETSEGEPEYCIDLTFMVVDHKLGMAVKTDGNEWGIENLYIKISREWFRASKENTDRDKLYLNASWKLEPLLDDYHLWLDDYVAPYYEQVDYAVELFRLVDENTGKTFTYTLRRVWDNARIAETVKENP